MIIYTIGFTKRTAKEFFGPIRSENIELLIDVRLNNESQLAGFTKGKDIGYFLDEICSCKYEHNILLSPTKEILDNYKNGAITWGEYEEMFNSLMTERDVSSAFKDKYAGYEKVCLLCSEPEPEKCHRRLVAEAIKDANPDWEVMHL